MATSKKKATSTTTRAARKASAGLAVTAKDYSALLAEVKARIQSAQYTALRAVNKELVGLYQDIAPTTGW